MARPCKGALPRSPTADVASPWATRDVSAAEQLDISNLRPNNQTLSGYFLGAELLLSPRVHPMIAGLLADIARGELRVVVDRTFPLAEAAAAHAYIESRQSFGRVLLVP